MESYRIQRVEKEIKEIVSGYIVYQLAGVIDGFITITRVICSRDLKTAKVLVHSFDGEDFAKKNVEILQKRAYDIQNEINSQLRMKYCPRILFFVDDKYEEALRVQEELRRLEMERREQSREPQDSVL